MTTQNKQNIQKSKREKTLWVTGMPGADLLGTDAVGVWATAQGRRTPLAFLAVSSDVLSILPIKIAIKQETPPLRTDKRICPQNYPLCSNLFQGSHAFPPVSENFHHRQTTVRRSEGVCAIRYPLDIHLYPLLALPHHLTGSHLSLLRKEASPTEPTAPSSDGHRPCPLPVTGEPQQVSVCPSSSSPWAHCSQLPPRFLLTPSKAPSRFSWK